MRRCITAQLQAKGDICIFCALRPAREVAIQRSLRLRDRSYHSSTNSRAAAAAAVAPRRQNDEDQDDFPMLRHSAASEAPAPSRLSKSRVNVDLPSTPSPGFRITKLAVGGAQPSPRERENSWQSRQSRFDGNSDKEYRRFGYRSQEQSQELPQSQRRWQGLRTQSATSNLNGADRGHGFGKGVRSGPEKLGTDSPYTDRKYDSNAHRTNNLSRPLPGPDARSRPSKSVVRPLQNVNGTSSIERSRSPMYSPRADTYTIKRWTPNIDEAEIQSDLQVGVQPKVQDKIVEAYQPFQPPQADSTQHKSGRSNIHSHPPPRIEAAADIPYSRTYRDETAASTTNETRSRFSSRFDAADEEDDHQITTHQPRRAHHGTTRKKTADFDFDAFEAEDVRKNSRRERTENRVPKPQKLTITIPEFMTVHQLAQGLKIKTDQLVRKLAEEGFEGARFDHMLDAETSTMFADIYGYEPIILEEKRKDLVPLAPAEDSSTLPPRPPIVTIMGHVDHGKTTILDWLRKSSVVEGEHGGITQHIGAFSVVMPGTERRITFLDTPGHEAFLDMRRRGANVTDIVVLVVAADDSVKPQTVEAIKHALDARVQIIVAINKVDKNDANIDQVKQDLTRHDIVVEDYGGDIQAIPVSGKTGQGMEQLEEAIITLADVLDLRAEQHLPAEGQIIESKVTNAGRVATVLVQRGILHVGDFIVAGPTWGRVRTLRNDAGQLVQAAYPGDPVQVDGWRGVDPTAGLVVLQADNEQHAKDVVDLRLERIRATQSAVDASVMNASKSREAEDRAKVLEWEAENKINARRRRDNEGWIEADDLAGPKKVHFVVKADVAGSVEAIVAAVAAIGSNEIQANVIYSGTGPVTESDIRLLSTSDERGYAISFNQSNDPAIYNLAEEAGVQILDHNIIYKVTDVVKEKVSAALPPLITQRVLGEAEVGKIFEITVKKQKIKIAGCKITNGTISRTTSVRVIREGETVYTGTLHSLKNVKKDVTEMRKGTECGMGFKDWEEIQEGDQVQCFEEKVEKRTLY